MELRFKITFAVSMVLALFGLASAIGVIWSAVAGENGSALFCLVATWVFAVGAYAAGTVADAIAERIDEGVDEGVDS